MFFVTHHRGTTTTTRPSLSRLESMASDELTSALASLGLNTTLSLSRLPAAALRQILSTLSARELKAFAGCDDVVVSTAARHDALWAPLAASRWPGQSLSPLYAGFFELYTSRCALSEAMLQRLDAVEQLARNHGPLDQADCATLVHAAWFLHMSVLSGLSKGIGEPRELSYFRDLCASLLVSRATQGVCEFIAVAVRDVHADLPSAADVLVRRSGLEFLLRAPVDEGVLPPLASNALSSALRSLDDVLGQKQFASPVPPSCLPLSHLAWWR